MIGKERKVNIKQDEHKNPLSIQFVDGQNLFEDDVSRVSPRGTVDVALLDAYLQRQRCPVLL